MEIKEKDKYFLRDDVANRVLSDPKNKEYLASIIASSLDMDKKYVMENLEYYDNHIYGNIHTKKSEADVVIELPENYVNIEINYNNYKEGKIKNMIYVLHLVLRQTSPSENYQKLKKVYQINLNNYDYYHKGEFIYRSILMETKHHLKREDLLEIIDINLDFLYKLDYTEITKLNEEDLKWLLYIFVCQDEEKREKIYLKNKMIKKVDESLKRFTKEYDKNLFYNKEEFQKRAAYEEGRNDGYASGKNDGYTLGKDEGIEIGLDKRNKEIAKTMLKESTFDIEMISKITGLTKEEIILLKEEN